MAEQTYIFRGIVTALSSISHIGETSSTISEFRAEKIITPDGLAVLIPMFSGNGIRGQLRDTGMHHMCRAIGYDDPAQGLSLPAFHFLFSGGSLTSKSGKALNIAYARKLIEAIPLVGIFGGGVGNQLIPGKFKCGKMIPIGYETRGIVPVDVQQRVAGVDSNDYQPGDGLLSVFDYKHEEFYTRRDDAKNEHYKPLLSHAERLMLEDAEVYEAQKRESGDETPADDTGEHQQMRYSVVTLAAGTKLFWEIILQNVSDIEFEAFLTTLAQFSRAPYIGGKSSIGHGKVEMDFSNWIKIDPRTPPEGTEIAFQLGTLYANHLRDRAGDIRKILETIQ